MIYPRKTVVSACAFEGPGLHSGAPVKVTVEPASAGIRFNSGSGWILAEPNSVSRTDRCTCLGDISTVEHLMAAFAGCEITDADIHVIGGELPALDGSSKPYVDQFSEIGLETIGEIEFARPFSRIFVQEQETKLAISAGEGHWRYEFEIALAENGTMIFETANVRADFAEQIAPARTIAFEEQIEAARAAGLGRGLDENSVVVIGKSDYVYPARFSDEPARHKLLDAIGDLYLSGVPIGALNVVGVRSGHRFNVKAAERLRQAAEMVRR